MPAKGCEISPIKRIVRMHEAIDVIGWMLLTPIITDPDLLCFAKRVLWIFVIENV